MCILFIALKQHPNYPLIIAANRDEFHARPTLASHFWENQPNILAGKDISAGGTWMGINKSGDLAALTNIRAPGKELANAVSRGELASNYLQQYCSQEEYLQRLSDSRNSYNGYNLLFGNLHKLTVYNSFENKNYSLADGVYGLSNASLNSPWPKLDMGRSALARYCQNSSKVNTENLFELLSNKQLAKDDELPKTGVPIEWEKKLSSIFIESSDYGTRSSTVLLLDKENQVHWEERTFNATADIIGKEEYRFSIA